jgi:hypothetical protein
MNLSGIISAIDSQMTLPYNNTAFGLASRYYESPTVFYAGVIKPSGDVQNCYLSDISPLTYYHRIIRSTFNTIARSYGDKDDRVEEISDIDLVAFGTDLKITPQKLADIFVATLPSTLDAVTCESLSVTDCRIELISHETDPVIVWREETSDPKVRAGLNKALIKVRYRILCTYRRSCINVCDEC